MLQTYDIDLSSTTVLHYNSVTIKHILFYWCYRCWKFCTHFLFICR